MRHFQPIKSVLKWVGYLGMRSHFQRRNLPALCLRLNDSKTCIPCPVSLGTNQANSRLYNRSGTKVSRATTPGTIYDHLSIRINVSRYWKSRFTLPRIAQYSRFFSLLFLFQGLQSRQGPTDAKIERIWIRFVRQKSCEYHWKLAKVISTSESIEFIHSFIQLRINRRFWQTKKVTFTLTALDTLKK